MSVFHFKRFDVANERSAMKVNTDGVLLGAVTTVLPTDRRVLDIGTGTGTVALMLCQRLADLSADFLVEGVDIDLPAAEEAGHNFSESPWPTHLKAVHSGLSSFQSSGPYDLIVSNPPYFDSSLMAPDQRRNAARHTRLGADGDALFQDPLSFREVIEYSQAALSPLGRLSLILPSDQEKALLRHARMCGLVLWRLTRIKTVPHKPHSRLIAQFKRRDDRPVPRSVDFIEEEVVVSKENEKRASQQASLLTDFLL